MKIFTGVFTMMVLCSSALAQNRPAPSAQECIDAHPEVCHAPTKRTVRPAKRAARRRPADEMSVRRTDIDMTVETRRQDNATNDRLNHLDDRMTDLEVGIQGIREDLQNQPETPTTRVVENHDHLTHEAEERVSLFSVDLAGLISVRDNSRREVSPGGRLGARVRVGSLLLGVQGSYERVEFEDASVIEDFVFEPVARYEFLRGPLRPFAELSLGYWTERIVWMGLTSCGDNTCPPGERNSSFTSSAGIGVSAYPWRNVSFSIEPLALRWVPIAEANRPMWSFSPSASISLHIP